MLHNLIGKAKWNKAPNAATGAYFRTEGRQFGTMLTDREREALRAANFADLNADQEITRHRRVLINGLTFQTQNDAVQYNNAIAHVNEQYRGEQVDFVNIQSIITWKEGAVTRQGIFGHRFITLGAAFETTFKKLVQESRDLVYVPGENVRYPGVLSRSNGQIFISRVANIWDND